MNSEKDTTLKTDDSTGIITGKVSTNHVKFRPVVRFTSQKGVQGASSLRPVRSLKRRSIRPMGAIGLKREEA